MADNVLKAVLNIDVIGLGDVGKATKDLSQLEKQFKAFGGLKPFTNTSAGLTEFASKIKTVKPATDQATNALSNLSRVAQDAPYGFIGIANNLNPLLESFQRLKTSTGSTKAAFSSLLSGLTGPAGIGLALGVVSSLAVTFGDKLFGASKKTKELKEANDALGQSIAGDIVKLTSLVAVVGNVNSKQEDRAKGLKAINEQYGDYIKNLGIEKVTLDNLATAYDKIIDSILRQAVVKGLQQQIEKEVAKSAAAIIALGPAPKKVDPNELKNLSENVRKAEEEQKKQADKKADSLDKEKIAYASLERQIQKSNKPVTDGYIAQQNQLKTVTATVAKLDDYDTKFRSIKETLTKSLAPLFDKLQGFSIDDLDVKVKPPDKGNVEDVIARAKRIFAETKDIITLPLDIRADDNEAAQKAKAQAYLDNYFKGNYKIKINAEPVFSAPPEQSKELGSTFAEYFYSGFKEYQDRNSGDAGGLVDAVKLAKQIDFIKSVFNIGKKYPFLSDTQNDATILAETISGAVVPAFESMINAIGTGKNAFQSFFQAIGQGIKQVFAQLAGKAALAGILSLIPGLGLTGGFSGIFKGLLGLSGARAHGGPVGSGGSYLVGERGPEIFTPNVNGSIIPNGRLNSYGGGSLAGQVQFVISGNNLVGVLSSANRSQNRLG